MKPAHALRLGVILIALSLAAHGQAPVTGTPPFGSFGGRPDVIDLANLNAHLSIPIIQKAGRGMPFTYSLSYDTLIWTPVSVNGLLTWQPVSNWGWHVQTEVATGYISYTQTIISCYWWDADYVGHRGHDTVYSNWIFHDFFGVSHPFSDLSIETGICVDWGPYDTTATATDGSGYTLATNITTYTTIYDSGGRVFNPPVNNNTGAGTKTDTNGNQITVNSSGQFFDTLSSTAPALTVSGGPPTVTFTYTAPGGPAASTMNYTTYTVATNFAVSGTAEYGRTSIALVDNITLPDGTKYLFQYEPTPSTPAAGACTPLSGTFQSYCVTGRPRSVTLPTGGQISYSYSGGGTGVNGIWSDGSTATLTRQTPDGTWTYAQVKGSGAASTTTITDPQGNQTAIQFQGIYETQRQVSQLVNGTQTLLQTTNTCYNGSTSPCTGTAITLPITRRTVTAQLPGGSPSKVDTFYNSYGLLTENDEYDYGASNPTRKTLITYATLANNINSARYTVTVQDSSGNLAGKTSYTYDQSAVTSTSGTPQHVSVSGSRGNLTSIQYWTTGSTTIQKTFTYYDTGTLNTASDVNNATTTYNYGSGGCGNSFPTSVNLPLNLTRSMTWNCTGGVQTSLTDENGQTVSTAYTDAYFWRPASTTDQAGNTTTLAYTGATVVESSLLFNGNSSVVDVRNTLDSLGRAHITQQKQSPSSSNYDSVETDYDSLGRSSRVTVPYSGTAGQTSSGAATTSTYDPFSRPLKVTDGGGGTAAYTYTQNDILSTVSPAPTGENTKRRQSEYDGLGRLTSACELTSLSGSGTCGQASSQPTGYWTKYTYDPLNNIVGVTQNAQSSTTQTRTFTYDLRGRLISESNPESGTTSYTYDTDTTCGTYSGDFVKRVDAVGNTTCYAYDSLHRRTSATYKSGPYSPTSITPTKCYVYDSATVNGQTMSYAATRLAEAYTTSAASCNGTGKITDIGFSYSKRGELTDVYESTPHSGGYYHSTASYWANGALNTLNPLNTSALPTITYGVDGEGRPNSAGASSGTNPVLSTAYCLTTGCNNNTAAVGQLTGVTFGTYDSDAFQYDPNTGRMTQYKFTVGSTPTTVTGNLGWNANGTLASLGITDQFNSANTQNCAYAYDDLVRIASVNCGSVWSQTFGFDPFGNLTKSGSVSFQPGYTYISGSQTLNNNRIQTLPGFTPTYDANGNTTADSLHTYAWDAEGHPITIDSIVLTYDAKGRMVEQQNGTSYTEILYGPTGKLALMNGQSVTKAFIPLPAGAMAVYTSGATLSYFRHPDWLGSSRFASTPSRTMYYSGAYAPFGEAYAEAGTPDRSFTGQNQDTIQGTTTGLYDFLFREHAQYGRWISPDPAGLAAVDPTNPQSWNRYAYVLNNPLSLVDPLGLICAGGDDTPIEICSPTDDNGPVGGGGFWGWATSSFWGAFDASVSGQQANYIFANWQQLDAQKVLGPAFYDLPGYNDPIAQAEMGYFADVLKAFSTDPCVYLNDPGNNVESVDHNSNPSECAATGGRWVQPQPPGTLYRVVNGQVQPFQPLNQCIADAKAQRFRERAYIAGAFALGSIAEIGCLGTGPGEILCANIVFGALIAPAAVGWYGTGANYQAAVNRCNQLYGEP